MSAIVHFPIEDSGADQAHHDTFLFAVQLQSVRNSPWKRPSCSNVAPTPQQQASNPKTNNPRHAPY